jgi:pimeloyl-ACP methyl ester carboxylesterase
VRHIPTTGGLSLAVHELGGSGRPTLLCHATGFHGAVWEPLAAQLGDGLERWAVDFRAHGASTVPPGLLLDWHDFRDDVLSVLDALELPAGEVLGVGHSMGGAALLLAEQARPGTFAGLWLYEPIVPPGGRMPSGPNNPMAETAERRRASFPSVADAVANYASKPPLNRLRSDAMHAYVRHGVVAGEDGAVHLACRPADEAQTYRGAGSHAAFDHLDEVRCPVVIAAGDEGVGPELFAQAAADALSEGRLEPFDHLGHFGPLEAPPRVAAAIRRFAESL